MERVAEHGTLWFCNWNKDRRDEGPDELRTSLIGGMSIGAWMDKHPDWFVAGEWSEDRRAFPVRLTDAGRAALADRSPWDMEPVTGGMVEPGWIAVPARPRAEGRRPGPRRREISDHPASLSDPENTSGKGNQT